MFSRFLHPHFHPLLSSNPVFNWLTQQVQPRCHSCKWDLRRHRAARSAARRYSSASPWVSRRGRWDSPVPSLAYRGFNLPAMSSCRNPFSAGWDTEIDEPGFVATDLYTTRPVQTKPLTQNTHNTQNPTEQGNCAYCANSAYRDEKAESSKCWKPLMRRSSHTGGRFWERKGCIL